VNPAVDKGVVSGDMGCLITQIEKERYCADEQDNAEDNNADLFLVFSEIVCFAFHQISSRR
jgi:hypothetical protein